VPEAEKVHCSKTAAGRRARQAAELPALGRSVTNASRHFREQYRRLFHQPRR